MMRFTLGYMQDDQRHVVVASRSASLAEVVAECEHVFGCANTVLEVAVGSRRAIVSDAEQLRDGDHLHLSKKRSARVANRPRKCTSCVVYEESDCSEEEGGEESEDESEGAERGCPPRVPSENRFAQMMEVLQIRSCAKADLGEIMKIERATSEEMGYSTYSEETMAALLKYTDVIEVDGMIGGFCTHHMLTHTIMKDMKRLGFDYARGKKKGRCADTMQITNIAVRKELRGMGYAKRLVKTAVRKHSKHKFTRYAATGEVTHCIEKVLRAMSYVPTDGVDKESTYANGKDSLRFVFRRPS